MESCCVLFENKTITIQDLPDWFFEKSKTQTSNNIQNTNFRMSLKEFLESNKKQFIENCIKKHQGNIAYASKELGISRSALYSYLDKN